MYKNFSINDLILYDMHHTNNNITIVSNNKLENNCSIYIYQIRKIDKLYYLDFKLLNYINKENNIGIHEYINNIEKDNIDKLIFTNIDVFSSLNNTIEFLISQIKKIHKTHYLIQNSNIYKNSKIYYIHYISKLLNY